MTRLLMAAFVSIFLLCGAAGCPPQPTPPTPDADSGPAPQPVDAGPDAAHDACDEAEIRLIMLGCKDSRGRLLGGPTLKGLAWSQVCRNNAINGIDMHPACIVSKTSCDGVNQCR